MSSTAAGRRGCRCTFSAVTSGDWRRIRARLGAAIPGNVLAVPHHGGRVSSRRTPGEAPEDYRRRVAEEQRWLYTQAVTCSLAVVSVGTSNDYGHPRQESISAMRQAGMVVMCTQITPGCHDDLERLRPGVIRPAVPSQSRTTPDTTRGGHSRNLACAGTVIAEIGSDRVTIQRLREHQAAVDQLASDGPGHPLCRTTV